MSIPTCNLCGSPELVAYSDYKAAEFTLDMNLTRLCWFCRKDMFGLERCIRYSMGRSDKQQAWDQKHSWEEFDWLLNKNNKEK